MAASIETLPKTAPHGVPGPPKRPITVGGPAPVVLPWLRAQSINVARHAAALRPFRMDEFGRGSEAPTAGHTQAVNHLITTLRRGLLQMAGVVRKSGAAAIEEPSTGRLQDLMLKKERAHKWVRGIEKIWDFYFEVFGQRQTRYAKWLLSCDRIGLDCYRASYLGLGVARPIPAPPPFSYMATGFAPATFRRGIPLKRLGKQLNPFPLIQLPYHRLINPWTLGAVLHEVSHNLQTDLGAIQGCTQESWLASSEGRSEPSGGTLVGPLEPGNVRRHERTDARRTLHPGIADGHSGSRTGDGNVLQSAGPTSDAVLSDADQYRTRPPHGV